jgi:prepilin-type N-terminal cleavage/methylation domain-containing protein
MGIHILNKKIYHKGMSLIELTVAMAILVMVFAGAVTLIVMVVNLAYNSGLKTIAVSLAQKGLTDRITSFRATPADVSCIIEPISALPTGMQSLKKCISPDPSVPNGQPGDFVLVTSEVTWYPKGDPNLSTYQMTQIIRKSYQ